MPSSLFKPKETKGLKDNVASLFGSMSKEFRDHLMHAAFISSDRLQKFLTSEVELTGDVLKEVSSHLESVLVRIQLLAKEKSNKKFPDFEEWRTENATTTVEDISRLASEGGMVLDDDATLESSQKNNEYIHYRRLKKEFDCTQKRGEEAAEIMKTPEYKKLEDELVRMLKVVDQKTERPGGP